MAARWTANLHRKVFTIFSSFSRFQNVFHNTRVFQPYFNQYDSGLKSRRGFIQFRPFYQTFPIIQQSLASNQQHQKKFVSFLPPKRFGGSFFAKRKPVLCGEVCNGVLFRGVTTYSKKGKRKTCKAVAKRFIRTGKGKLKRWRCGYHHNQTKKTNRRKRFLRKPTYASKTQLKKLNKMLNGW